MTNDDDLREGWPDVVGDTTLTVKIPEVDALVRAGFGAHVTVLYPFLHISRVDDAVHRELTRLFASHDAFEVSFKEFGRFPGVLFLDPWPSDPFRALTKELTGRWPEAVPYRGILGDVDPHLTLHISDGPDGCGPEHDALEAELEPLLPVDVRVDAVDLLVWDGSEWQDRVTYGLGRVPRQLSAG